MKDKDLTKCNGRRFTATYKGGHVTGRISVSPYDINLEIDPTNTVTLKTRIRISRSVSPFIIPQDEYLGMCGFSDLKIQPMTKQDIEAYKDWQVGDKIRRITADKEVIFRQGEVVICKCLTSGDATAPYTCDELYKHGYRLCVAPEEMAAEEKEVIVTVTMEEIARLKGVSVDKLRIDDSGSVYSRL